SGPFQRRARIRPTGCGEEQVGGVAPTYGQPAQMPFAVAVAVDLDLDLDLRAPPKRRSRRTRPAGRRTGMCGVFRGGRMPPRKIPPAPRTRCNAPGAKAGCAFFAPGFFAQAKKGGSRRHGAKALDPKPLILMPAEQSTSGGVAPTYGGSCGAGEERVGVAPTTARSPCRYPMHRGPPERPFSLFVTALRKEPPCPTSHSCPCCWPPP